MVEAYEVGVDTGVGGRVAEWNDLPSATYNSGQWFYISGWNAFAYSDGTRWKLDRSVTIYANSPNDVVTGTTSLTAFRNVLIPGGVLGKNGVVRIDPILKYTSNSNAKNAGYRISQEGGVLSGTQMWQHSQASVSVSSIPLILSNDNSELQQVAATSGSTNGSVGQSVSANEATASVDTTQDWYITMTISPASAGDTCTLRRLSVVVEPNYS